jgi:hypothetical protein
MTALEKPVDLPQQVIGWNTILKTKFVEQFRLTAAFPPHHDHRSPGSPRF